MAGKIRFGAVIIGDEILTGKRQDKHLPRVIDLLADRGLELTWARYAGDDDDMLIHIFRESLATGDIVFSFGGIGGTPDDRTRQAAAAAAGRALIPHPQGIAELRARFPAAELTPQRLRMVEFPEGAELIPNPINRVPGFSLGSHHFVPGFPNMAWPMIEWVLDSRYAALQAPGTIAEQVILVQDCRESQITELMEQYVGRYPALRMSCLPQSEGEGYQLELGLRGEPARVAEAMRSLQRDVGTLGFHWRPVTLRRN